VVLFVGQAHCIGLRQRGSCPLASDCLTIDLPNRGHFSKYKLFAKSVGLMRGLAFFWSRWPNRKCSCNSMQDGQSRTGGLRFGKRNESRAL
jgi:hypothetical protein